MKSTLFVLFFTVISFLSFTYLVQPVSAAGDMQISTQSDVMYLTTTTTGTNSGTILVSTLSGTQVPFFGGSVRLPPGFFLSADDLSTRLLRVIMIVAVILVFVYLIWGGFQYITSGGEKGKTEAARNKIVAAIVGLIILASSYAILTIALQFIGFQDMNGFLKILPPSPAPTPNVTPTPNSPLQLLIR